MICTTGSSPSDEGKHPEDRKIVWKERAGILAIMGSVEWKKAQKSEVPSKDNHLPEKRFSRISNTKILRLTETELEKTSRDSGLRWRLSTAYSSSEVEIKRICSLIHAINAALQGVLKTESQRAAGAGVSRAGNQGERPQYRTVPSPPWALSHSTQAGNWSPDCPCCKDLWLGSTEGWGQMWLLAQEQWVSVWGYLVGRTIKTYECPEGAGAEPPGPLLISSRNQAHPCNITARGASSGCSAVSTASSMKAVDPSTSRRVCVFQKSGLLSLVSTPLQRCGDFRNRTYS